jgi:hypothetical protein
MGNALQKMFEETGISHKDVYYISRRPDTDSPMAISSVFEQKISQYKPPLLIAVGEVAQWLCSECQPYNKVTWQMQLNKQVGSLLKGAWPHPHYLMPLQPIEAMMIDYAERNIATYIDLGKIKDELEFWRKNGILNPLPQRTLLHHEMSTDEILSNIKALSAYPYLSVDIETVYPRKGSDYYQKHPGLPVVLGIAPSPDWAISFSPWRETDAENIELWYQLDSLLSNSSIIGQNFFLFDSQFLSSIGFTLDKNRFQDTLIRHHILWPELSHKLQFQCRQYTREPYYKDEGKQWSMKQLSSLRRYNALDAAVTFEVYLGQEEEFKQRPALKGAA